MKVRIMELENFISEIEEMDIRDKINFKFISVGR